MSRDLPPGWTAQPLSELADYHNGRAFKPEDWSSSGLPIIRIAQMNDASKEFDYYPGSDIDPRHVIDNGSLLFSWSATLSAMKWNRGPGILNQHIFNVVPKAGVDQDFLLHTISHSIDALAEHSHGSTMKHIKKGVLKLHHVAVPPLAEQRRIAEILSSVDEAIQATQAVIEQTQKVKQVILEHLLTAGVGPRPGARTALHIVPTGWKRLRLGDVISQMDSGWSPDCDTVSAGKDEWGILKTSAVLWEGYRAEENKRLPESLSPRPAIEVKAGDVLITRAGPVDRTGVVSYVKNTRSKLMLSDKIIRIQSNPEVCLSEFLALALSSRSVQLELIKRKSGMAMSQTNISQKTLRDTWVPIPPLQEQRKISDILQSISDAVQTVEVELASAQSAKAALMADLLTGRRRVSASLPLAAE